MKQKRTQLTTLRVLYLEDSPRDVEILRESLTESGYDLTMDLAATKKEFASFLRKGTYDVILSDFKLPGFDAFGALQLCLDFCPNVPFICVSGSIGEETAIKLIHGGAVDYVLKDRPARLPLAIKRALDLASEKQIRRRAEEELIKSEALLRTAVENLPLIFYQIDPDGKFKLSIGAGLKGLGLKPNQVVGQSAFDVYKDFPNIKDSVKRALAGESVEFESHVGKSFFANYLAPFSHLKGAVDGIVGVALDVTERKHAGESLRENEEFFRLLFTTSPDAILIFDPFSTTVPWEIVDCNESACRMNGYTREELLGKSIDMLLTQPTTSQEREAYVRMVEQKGVANSETTHRHRDGHIVPIEVANSIVILRGRRLMLGIDRDVTERKRAQEAIRESEARYRAIVEQSVIGIGISRGNQIIFANAALLRIFGYDDLAEFVKYPLMHHVAPTSQEMITAMLKTAKNEADSQREFECDIIRKDGTTRTLRATTTTVALEHDSYTQSTFQDVTERKQMEEALRASETQLSTAVKLARLGHWEYDVKSDTFTFNDQFYAMLRTTADDVGGYAMSSTQYAQRFVHPDDLQLVGVEIQKALETKDPHYTAQLDHRILYGDGEAGYITVRIFVVKDDQGRTIRTYGVNQDITDRKKAEEALRREQSLLRALMDNLPDVVYFKDSQSRFLRISRSLANKFALDDPSQAIGKSDFDFFAEDHARPAFEDEQKIIKDGNPIVDFEEREVWADGREAWVSTTKVPLQDANGQIIGTFGLSRDITARKLAENQLKRQAAAIQTAHDGMAILDADGLYLYVNKAHAEIYGYDKPDDLIGKSWEVLYDSDQLKRFHKTVIPTVYRKGSWIGDAIGKRRDKTKFPQEVSLTKLDDGGLVCVVRDTTERTRAEETQRLQGSALSAAASGIVITDTHGDVQWVNPAFSKMTGYTLGDIYGKNPRLLKSGFQDKDFYGNLWEMILKGNVWHGEVVNKRKDGSVYDEEMTITPVLDDQGVIKNFVAVKQDITERKKATEALKRYELLSENTRDIMLFVRTDDGSVIEANKAAEIAYGYTHDELLSLSIRDLRDPSAHAQLAQQMVEAQEKGIFFETIHRRKDGTTFPVEVSSRGADLGKTRVLMSIIRDVTQRKAADEQMRLLVHAMRSTAECVSITDLENQLLFVNEAMLKTYGYDEGELIGKNASIFRSESNDGVAMSEIIRETIRGGWQGEVNNKRKDGTEFPIWLSTSVVKDEQGEPVAFVGVATEMTERKKAEKIQKSLEDQLTQAQKMEAIGTLAGGIAHDFNNILGIILGHATLIQRAKGDAGMIATSVDTIGKAVQRGAGIVRQILTFARKNDPAREPLDVNVSTEELAKMLRETMSKTIEIDVEKGTSFPVVSVDQTQFQQAVMNLCINARDAIVESCGEGFVHGKLTIRTGRVSVKSLKEVFPEATASDYVSIAVSDTGTGIDEVTRKKIFEPFFTTKPLGKGTGLGLSVVYGVMKGHNGFVDVRSEMGKGSTFTLYFPSATSYLQEQKVLHSSETIDMRGNETIFVIEDEEAMAHAIVKILAVAGYTIITAKDGVEALETFEQRYKDIDLVLSDIGLPRLDGKELFAKLKLKDASVKVILASGYLDPEYKSELLKAGAKDFIQKPYDAVEVLKKIRSTLDA